MRFALSFLTLALLLTACKFKREPAVPVGDEAIANKLTGVWRVKIEALKGENKGTTIFAPDGHLLTKLTLVRTNNTRDVTYEGYWRIQDGFLLTTITNTDNDEVRVMIGHTNHLKIVGLNDKDLLVETKTGVNYLRREK